MGRIKRLIRKLPALLLSYLTGLGFILAISTGVGLALVGLQIAFYVVDHWIVSFIPIISSIMHYLAFGVVGLLLIGVVIFIPYAIGEEFIDEDDY